MVKVIINNIKKATIKTKDQPKKATIKTKSRSKRKKHLYNRETITDYEEHIGGGKISNLFNIFVNNKQQNGVISTTNRPEGVGRPNGFTTVLEAF